MRFGEWMRGQTKRTDAVGAAAKTWLIEGRQPDPLLMKAAVGEFQQTFTATGDPVERRVTDDDLVPRPATPVVQKPRDGMMDRPISSTLERPMPRDFGDIGED